MMGGGEAGAGGGFFSLKNFSFFLIIRGTGQIVHYIALRQTRGNMTFKWCWEGRAETQTLKFVKDA